MIAKNLIVAPLFVGILFFNSHTVAECTPPGEREYHKEWLITAGQSLLHDCALGGLVNFSILSIFDPTQMILNIIKGKACNFVAQKTQPFRDSLNAEIDAINDKISEANQFQSSGAWKNRIDSVWNTDPNDKFDAISSGKLKGTNFYGESIEMDDDVAETVFNGGVEFNEEGQAESMVQPIYTPPSNTLDESTKEGLLKRGADTGLENFPLPTPKEWGDVYNGTIN